MYNKQLKKSDQFLAVCPILWCGTLKASILFLQRNLNGNISFRYGSLKTIAFVAHLLQILLKLLFLV